MTIVIRYNRRRTIKSVMRVAISFCYFWVAVLSFFANIFFKLLYSFFCIKSTIKIVVVVVMYNKKRSRPLSVTRFELRTKLVESRHATLVVKMQIFSELRSSCKTCKSYFARDMFCFPNTWQQRIVFTTDKTSLRQNSKVIIPFEFTATTSRHWQERTISSR